MLKIEFKKLFLLALISFTMSCNKTATLETQPEKALENILVKSKLEKEMDIKKSYCFRNETPFKENANEIDILELKLDVIGTSVTGIYNWLPKFKDRREGTITGSIKENIIKGKYQFIQEGKEASVPIEIQLNENSVVISNDDKGLGIGATINRTNCSL